MNHEFLQFCEIAAQFHVSAAKAARAAQADDEALQNYLAAVAEAHIAAGEEMLALHKRHPAAPAGVADLRAAAGVDDLDKLAPDGVHLHPPTSSLRLVPRAGQATPFDASKLDPELRDMLGF